MICSLTGAVSSEIVSKVRKWRGGLYSLSVMAKACLTAKLTNCAGMNWTCNAKAFSNTGTSWQILFVGHNEPEVIFRRFPLIIGEDC